MIEYIEESHTYLIDGVITPSVSEILANTRFKHKYDGVPSYILQNKAQFGTNVHKAIEIDSDHGLSLLEKNCYQQWKKIKSEYQIEPIQQEVMVWYKDLYAGRFDMIAQSSGTWLIDFKTTASLDKEYLSYQMSMYVYAYEWLMKLPTAITNAVAIWLPKGKIGELVQIPIKPWDEVEKVINEYFNEVDENYPFHQD